MKVLSGMKYLFMDFIFMLKSNTDRGEVDAIAKRTVRKVGNNNVLLNFGRFVTKKDLKKWHENLIKHA